MPESHKGDNGDHFGHDWALAEGAKGSYEA